MIEKEFVQQRRKEIAEIRHADSVYRDIQAREEEREEYEKRWFWELLQNAKDSIEGNQSIRVKIEITDKQISFSHTGNPFELDDILSLIIQGSSKSNKEGKTGRFGTGFMTTYLLSKRVRITGKLMENQGCFSFLLNRDATDNDHFYRLQLESNKEFDDSIREESYLDTGEFQTLFTYELDSNGKETAKIGLLCLDELIPITQLFNEQIESVTVIESGTIKTFSKVLLDTHEEVGIVEWQISTVVDSVECVSLKAYIQKDDKFEACIITELQKNKEFIFPLTSNYPRLYYTFPLIGTEEIGIPLIINSTNFDPRVERDGIYLKKISEDGSESSNKEIINKALTKSMLSFANLFKSKNIKGLYELFSFDLSKDLKWIDHEWFTAVKNKAIELLASEEFIRYNDVDEKYSRLKDLTISFSDKKEHITELWNLLSEIKDLRIPLHVELFDWIRVAEKIAIIKQNVENTYDLDFVWGMNELIETIEEKESLSELDDSLNIKGHIWLNRFYPLVVKIKGQFPLGNNISLNQKDIFRKAEGMSWDISKDDELVAISDLIELNFGRHLFSRQITEFSISSVERFSIQNAISELKSELNDLTETDLAHVKNQEASARFLKWLIVKENKDIIKDLKVLTGANKKNEESFGYDHFPKTDHLLLTPKAYFEAEFPLYANLIRDKDCLNEIYNTFLETDDYVYLSNNGFVHLTPIVIKTENATVKLLEHLLIHENDLNLLRDADGQLKYKFEVSFLDFAYLTASDGHIYSRNTTQKSSLERLKFMLTEAVDKDRLFDEDKQEIILEGLENPIYLRQSLWVYRARNLNWINVKTQSEGSEAKFVSETPSSKNLSELLKNDEGLIKTIRGARQQSFLNKLGVGVSDLIRNTLPSDELRLSWDKAITNMITSDADPELVQEIFSDPGIKKEYERRLNERKLIGRNQSIGNLIEILFKEYIDILRAKGASLNIERRPFGSDYILTEESSDLVNANREREGFKINNWLIELKATGKEHAAMTPLQAQKATEEKDNYALVVVPLNGTDPDIEYLRQHAKVISNIGHRINKIYPDYNEVEIKKGDLHSGKDGISVNIEDQNIRFNVNSEIWISEHTTIEAFVKLIFKGTTN
ncbi:sacsin N-terminal ATP-binding-like domain-containing protein [Flavobacterium adhaerens]|uniref:sacsin N-terminal ATP-binding-like domain-containing protein n=1 Tax=Flavobacterium adhaerens TaxID=3149043 RepID=UPI0032B48169